MNKPALVFEFTDYRNYLASALAGLIPARGARSRLAAHLGCQTAFISQVLAGKVHFSLEHAVKIGGFLGLSGDEDQFFVLLVHCGRAGSTRLREYYQKQIDAVLERRQLVEARIKATSDLSQDDQALYYSSWAYSAVHVAVSIPNCRKPQELAARLGLPLGHVHEILEFLTRAGLVRRKGSGCEVGNRRIHLGRNSPLISKHHTNWRMKTIQTLDLPPKQDLHYSGLFSLTLLDFVKIRELLLESIERAEPILRESREETLGALCLDWFSL